MSSLTYRVSQVENTITSQSQSITSLTSTINTIRTQGANPWVDGTFESYSDGQVLGGNGTAVVVASQKFTGNKSLQVSRGANNNGNSDKQLGSWQSVREDAKFRFEFWAMMLRRIRRHPPGGQRWSASSRRMLPGKMRGRRRSLSAKPLWARAISG
ncbi:hypothetical protein NX009_21605 [Klebsiella pneumoniae]|nr:hypothetical protein [Klebsiella pneumoniae]